MITLVFGCLALPARLVTESAHGWLKLFATALCRLAGSRTRLYRQGALEEELGGFDSKRGPIRAESGAKLLAAVPPRGERSGSR